MLSPYYDHNGITIYHGDCREILPKLEPVDLLLTDPPYAIGHVDGAGFSANSGTFYQSEELGAMLDFDLTEYAALLSASADQIVAFHSRDLIRDYADFILREFGRYDLHVWHKTNAIPFVNNMWISDLEYIAVGYRSKQHAKVPSGMKSKVYSSGILTGDGKVHPTQKPLGLILKYLTVLNPATVVDPFMGAGTTLVGAKQLGIRAVGIEVNQTYCDHAVQRLAQEVMAL